MWINTLQARVAGEFFLLRSLLIEWNRQFLQNPLTLNEINCLCDEPSTTEHSNERQTNGRMISFSTYKNVWWWKFSSMDVDLFQLVFHFHPVFENDVVTQLNFDHLLVSTTIGRI